MKLENIDKSIQKQDILQDISLEVSPQKLTAFIWSKWCWKIDSPLHHEQTNQERSGDSQYQRP